ncbi:tubulin epsilon and delta complex protein 2 isoform X2 [Apteryx mantelli]|uniref:Tubulin epsilon and delta complex protein 2 isoform X2 n=1 Tax=Apteryx mantelli TaxID=2696672 RepID=A0ABM4FBC8_9AVES
MLPAGCGGRLAAALAAALGDGAERRRELEQQAARSRALLGRWDTEDEEQLKPDRSSSNEQESRPSPKELEELELLNRALEKALKVRKSILKTPPEARGGREGEKAANEGPAPKNAQVQQVLVSSEGVPVTTKVRAVSKKPTSSKKPSSYLLTAPYRTDPDVKKPHRKAPARCVCQAPRTAGKSPSKAAASKQARNHRLAISASNQEVCGAAESQKTTGLSKCALLEQQSVSIGDSARGKNLIAAGRQLFDAGKEGCGSLGESSRREDHTTEDALGRNNSPQTDTLQEKGSQLKFPLLYRKAYSRNSSLQELRDLFALKLQVSMLNQEIAIQKVMMAELLPVLESRLHPEASAIQLYRAIYTQLCEGGKRFPVLVRDELLE